MMFSAPQYRQDENGNLLASRCKVCGETACPPRLAHCDHLAEEVRIAPQGMIEAATVVRVAPEIFSPPYGLAFVRMDSGPRVVARMQEADVEGADIAGCAVTLSIYTMMGEESGQRAILWATPAVGK